MLRTGPPSDIMTTAVHQQTTLVEWTTTRHWPTSTTSVALARVLLPRVGSWAAAGRVAAHHLLPP
ncbi:MAG: hypothetical protein WCD51_11290 [Anaerolineae bacterium]